MSAEADPALAWCRPPAAQLHWAHAPVMRRVVTWANNVGGGKQDLRETLSSAEFIDGGTVGPAKR